MESTSPSVPFPLLKDKANYDAATIHFRNSDDPVNELSKDEKMWITIFRNSIPSFKKRAELDETVENAKERAEKFATRFANILDGFERDPESFVDKSNCASLCRLREVCLREVGFEDIFKSVKAEENEKALTLLPAVLKTIDSIDDPSKRIEHIIKGIFAGNIFDLGAPGSAELFEKNGISFEATLEKLVDRPWVIDHFDNFKDAWLHKKWNKAIIFCDNAGADVVLGILPFVRELIRKGTQVVLAANDMPSINDITYHELLQLVDKAKHLISVDVDDSRASLLVVNSGNDLPVIDLSEISPELAYIASDADLVVLEGMGRSIETNLHAKFTCDSLNIGMVKHKEVADFLGGRIYDCVIKYSQI